MLMIERLKILIDNLHISVRSFEVKIGASDGMIRRAINNNTDIQSKWLSNIAENYPNISMEWLVAGRGEMLRQNEGVVMSVQKVEPTIIYKSDPKDLEIIQLLRDKVKLLEQNAKQSSPQLGFYAPRQSSASPAAEDSAITAFPTTNKPSKGKTTT